MTGRMCCLEGRSSAWGWPDSSTTSKLRGGEVESVGECNDMVWMEYVSH